MILIWIGFLAFVLALLALDLGVLHRKAHIVSVKEALLMSALWIALGLAFSVFVYYGYEHHWLGLGSSVDSVDDTINDGQSATIKMFFMKTENSDPNQNIVIRTTRKLFSVTSHYYGEHFLVRAGTPASQV